MASTVVQAELNDMALGDLRNILSIITVTNNIEVVSGIAPLVNTDNKKTLIIIILCCYE